MMLTIGIVRTAGEKRLWGERFKNGFHFCVNLIKGKFGFYCWLECKP